jgi:hypothetical protein
LRYSPVILLLVAVCVLTARPVLLKSTDYGVTCFDDLPSQLHVSGDLNGIDYVLVPGGDFHQVLAVGDNGLVLLFRGRIGVTSWMKLGNIPVSDDLMAVSCRHLSTGGLCLEAIAVGEDGTAIVTFDAGNNWTERISERTRISRQYTGINPVSGYVELTVLQSNQMIRGPGMNWLRRLLETRTV